MHTDLNTAGSAFNHPVFLMTFVPHNRGRKNEGKYMPKANGQAYQLGAMQHIKLLFFENIKQDGRVVYLNVTQVARENSY